MNQHLTESLTLEQKQNILEQTRAYAQRTLMADSTGHDWWHIHRVAELAVVIARDEGLDEFVVELAALLHDIADWKFHVGDESKGTVTAKRWLEDIDVPQPVVDHVASIVSAVSFKGAGVPDKPPSREAMAVQDADRLDALGAIGIARTFAYGGFAQRPMYEPDDKPVLHATFEQYKNSKSHTINHFYEKLLLLKDRIHTKKARKIAEIRHKYMEQFLERFFTEWNCQP